MNQVDPQQLHALQAMLIILPFVALIYIVLVIIPYWMIWKKAGFSPLFSLLMLVPLANLVMLYVLPFSEWKVVPIGQNPYPGSYPGQYPGTPPPSV